jgi:hypothetical protein
MACNHQPTVREWDGATRGSLLETLLLSSWRGIPAGAATGGSRAVGSGDGMPQRTTVDTMTHDGRWTGGH